jgi:hypothetical protein
MACRAKSMISVGLFAVRVARRLAYHRAPHRLSTTRLVDEFEHGLVLPHFILIRHRHGEADARHAQ